MVTCEDLYCARIRACLEGDYTTWTSLFSPTDMGEVDFTWVISIGNDGIAYLSAVDVTYVVSISGAITTLTDLEDELVYAAFSPINPVRSIYQKYRLFRDVSSSPCPIHVYKDNVDIQTITPSWSSPVGGYNITAISPDGKYIVVAWKDSDNHIYVQIFEGS